MKLKQFIPEIKIQPPSINFKIGQVWMANDKNEKWYYQIIYIDDNYNIIYNSWDDGKENIVYHADRTINEFKDLIKKFKCKMIGIKPYKISEIKIYPKYRKPQVGDKYKSIKTGNEYLINKSALGDIFWELTTSEDRYPDFISKVVLEKGLNSGIFIFI